MNGLEILANGLAKTNVNRIEELETQLAEARAEIESKSRLIEQMLEALEAVVRVADRATVDFDMARAAIKAAKGEI